MERTLNQIKKDLQEIATQHRQINSFFFGDFVDAINQDVVDYTIMTATIQPGSMGDNFVTVSLSIVIGDKYNVDDYRTIDEVHSDCLQICNDIRITMRQNKFEEYLSIEGDIATTPFINRGADMVAGWSMDLTLTVFSNEDWCAIPYESYNFGN